MPIFKKITIEDFLCSHMIGIHIPRLKGYNHYIHKYCILTTVGSKKYCSKQCTSGAFFKDVCGSNFNSDFFIFQILQDEL